MCFFIYDFAFVDAEKRMYREYFELLLQLVRVGGLIVIDNVLWHGKVANPLINDAKTVSIRNFNRSIMEDKRVSISMKDMISELKAKALVDSMPISEKYFKDASDQATALPW
ncbi:S-adenosyl-L-methionine-dependent methyltransferases superfamily protein [Actinidia rufa]|uniref:S-adenosyl-L-methionine-dependent methyltransferases superfamily protein n=1 Tax=Actinidia rufa TaxID=165716 RepID=A0A7J0F4E8_9ERIC|nr:S-adenosyl-L-methionine-dependent methyltransferases superfamily protein [Actinidia rufa]